MKFRTAWLAAALCVQALLSGCGTDTNFRKLAMFDSLSPQERESLILPFSSYVVGIEKQWGGNVGKVADCVVGASRAGCLAIHDPYFVARPELAANLRAKYEGMQLRHTFVSHIARFDEGRELCFIYNLYDPHRLCGTPEPASGTLVERSWDALAALGRDLDARFSSLRPSHVIVYTMGWNTLQPEALDNFRRLTRHLVDAAKAAGDAEFRPLVIGVTWPSTGSPTVPGSDYGIKAKDADEVGAIWENVLVNRELRSLKQRHPFRLVLIGHSFGARAASRAVFSAPLVVENAVPVVDLFLGLQGAFSFQRFLPVDDEQAPEGREGAPYRDHARQAGLVALTSSRHDTAVTRAGHERFFVGSHAVFERTLQGPYRSEFDHVSTDSQGLLAPPLSCDPKRVLMIDASQVVVGNEPGTSGGAHSVIYTPEIGHMTYQLIKACAP